MYRPLSLYELRMEEFYGSHIARQAPINLKGSGQFWFQSLYGKES